MILEPLLVDLTGLEPATYRVPNEGARRVHENAKRGDPRLPARAETDVVTRNTAYEDPLPTSMVRRGRRFESVSRSAKDRRFLVQLDLLRVVVRWVRSRLWSFGAPRARRAPLKVELWSPRRWVKAASQAPRLLAPLAVGDELPWRVSPSGEPERCSCWKKISVALRLLQSEVVANAG